MKKHLLFSVVLIVLMLVSCKVYPVVFEDEKDLSKYIITDTGKAVDLQLPTYKEGYVYSWYKCDEDGNISGSALTENKSKKFSDAGIQTYKCVGTKAGSPDVESEIYYVIYTGLPTVYINTASGEKITSKSEYVDASLVITDGSKQLVNMDDILIKGRGNTSWRKSEKKSYNIKLQTKLEKKLFGMKKSKRWSLIANTTDSSMLGNWIASHLGNDIFDSGWNPQYQHVNVVFNGAYSGTYTFCETVKIDDDRVDIEDISEIENDRNGDGKVSLEDGGFIVEFTLADENRIYSTLHGLSYALKDPDLDDEVAGYSRYETASYIQDKINAVEAAIMGDSKTPYEDVFDVDAAVDWYIVNEFMANLEAAFKTSTFAYYDSADGKLKMGPNWDFDRCISELQDITVNVERNIWFSKLLSDAKFKNAVRDRWNDKKGDVKALFTDLSKQAQSIEVAVAADRIRWGLSEQKTPEEIAMQWIEKRYECFDSYINK